MKIVHDSDDNNALDFLIVRGNIIYRAVGRYNRMAEQMSVCRKETTMPTNGHTTVWGTPIGVGRTRDAKSWYRQLRDWWTAHKTARRQASLDALHRRWDATREGVTAHHAEAAPEMAAAHHAISVATMLYGLSS
jgi:hypothetical protein